MTNQVFVQTAVLLVFVASSGCAIPSHIHSPANADAAKEARDAMVEYGKASPKMYSAMLANVDRFKAEEEYLLSELAANVSDSLVTKLPTMKWPDVKERADKALSNIENLRRDFAKAVGEASASSADAATLAARVAAAREAVKKAKQNVTDWNASVAVLQASLQQLVASSGAQSGPKSLGTLSDAIDTIGAKKVEYFDADGKKVTESVADVLKSRVPALLQGLRSSDGQKSLLEALPDAPGLELVVVNLGLELAELEQRRAQAQRADAAALVELLEDVSAQLAVAETLLKPVAVWLAGDDLKRPRPPEADNIFTRIEAERASKEGTLLNRINSASGYLVSVREVAVAESIVTRVSSTSTVAIARFAHTRSIRESSINDVQYQALIRAGLDALAAYHAGGLKSEDVANLIRFAQAVGVAVIAGGVY